MNNVIVRTNPYRMGTDFDRLFNSVFGLESVSGRTRSVAVDVSETDQSWTVELELPGYSEADVGIKVEDNLLIIESIDAAEATEANENQARYLIKERGARSFRRSFALPKEANQDSISAVFANGLLTLTVPKNEKAKPRTIEIRRV